MRLGFLIGALVGLLSLPAEAQQCRVDSGAGALALPEGTPQPLRCLPNGQLATSAVGGGGGGDGAITAPLGTATAASAGVSVSPAATTVWPTSQSGTWNVGLTGTLPAFASAPTVNLGTLGGAATDSALVAMSGKLPASLGAKTGAGSLSTVPATDAVFQSAQSGTWSFRAQDGAGNALTSAAAGAQRPLDVLIRDSSGNIINTFGGSGGTASNFSAAFPTAGTAVGVQNSAGTAMIPWAADSSGRPVVAVGNSVIVSLIADVSVNKTLEGTVASIGTATAYTSGQSIGGLQTIAVFRNYSSGVAPRSGVLSTVRVGLKGTNQTPPLTVYVWTEPPTASTCTNAATFVAGAADWSNLVRAFPIVPAAPTGTSMTEGYVDVAIPVVNTETTQTTNLYACVVTGASVTLAANDMTLHLGVEGH